MNNGRRWSNVPVMVHRSTITRTSRHSSLPVRQHRRFNRCRHTHHSMRSFTFTNTNTRRGHRMRTTRNRRRTSSPGPSQRTTIRVLRNSRHHRSSYTRGSKTTQQRTTRRCHSVRRTYHPFTSNNMQAKSIKRHINSRQPPPV